MVGRLRKKVLERLIEEVPPHPCPRIELEQYTTPAYIVADVLWRACVEFGDVEGRRVLDLGCGTGRFAYGAALLGADVVVGVDVDKVALEVARDFTRSKGLDGVVSFVQCDVKCLNLVRRVDTVFQNPPFGVHRRGADVEFLVKAMELADVVYTMHKASTRDYVLRVIEKYNFRAVILQTVEYPIFAMFPHHEKRKHIVLVDVIRAERC
ncbi:MAG: hypothetical protein DRJ40_09020 [Thermoprotei archaeon]|nr:MAG: hypothetical protein DRJ40_09020 [Thermoprotei archaeon]